MILPQYLEWAATLLGGMLAVVSMLAVRAFKNIQTGFKQQIVSDVG